MKSGKLFSANFQLIFDPLRPDSLGWEIEKFENWLEEMEWGGWNLSKVDYILRFKFAKGKSRKMRYCVDHQNNVENNYFELFKEDGWVLVDEEGSSVMRTVVYDYNKGFNNN